MNTKHFALALVVFSAVAARAESLSAVALYSRCYGQVTQLFPPDDARMAQVRAGSKNPINACLEVFDSARLTANGGTTLANPSDAVAQAVLRTFQGLHYSWFQAKQFFMLELSSPNWTDATFDVFDPSSPALYFTKALFDPAVDFKYAVTSYDNLRPVRSSGSPARGPYSGQTAAGFAGGSGAFLVQTGHLIGAAQSGRMSAGSLDLGATAGGGFLGTGPYIQAAVAGGIDDTPDGAVRLPRAWGRAVFEDALCRSLPAVRVQDVESLVVTSSQAPFRLSASCTSCHASMDRATYTIRGFRYARTSQDGNAYAPVAVRFVSPTAPAENSWLTSPDGSFGNRPSNGVFFFRAHDGTLVNQPVSGVADLGAKIAATDDFYICAAKRYFEYFTGIKVEIGDIADPGFKGGKLGSGDLALRQTVIDLGKKLKSTQDARVLIEDILRNPNYQRSDFGVAGQ